MEETINNILKELKNKISENYKINEMRLFGSSARGDRREDSDIDVFIILPKVNRRIEEDIFDSAYELELKHDCIIDVIIISDPVLKENISALPIYEKILENEAALQNEIELIHANMAEFLAAEKVYINGNRVEQEIIHVDIGLRGRPDMVFFQWVIKFSGKTLKEINSLVSDVEEELAEYDIEVMYLFPAKTRILEVSTPMEYEIRGPLLFVWGQKGDTLGGHEEVHFQFPES